MMRAADVLVGKAGGLTVSEALAVGLPLIIYNPVPGQELYNVDFLVNFGAGLLSRDEDDVVEKVRFLSTHPERLKQMTDDAAMLGKPGAAAECVRAGSRGARARRRGSWATMDLQQSIARSTLDPGLPARSGTARAGRAADPRGLGGTLVDERAAVDVLLLRGSRRGPSRQDRRADHDPPVGVHGGPRARSATRMPSTGSRRSGTPRC